MADFRERDASRQQTEFDHVTLGQRVLFRSGAAAELAVLALDDLRAERVLLIADAFVQDLSDEVARLTPVVARIHEIVQHVPGVNARDAVELARTSRADAVVSIGGGSSTGLAKIVARDTSLPIVAIPTTFAGSEATNVWGMTEGERKTTGVDNKVLPGTVIYDPSLMATMPTRLAVASAFNAAAHAIDGFWAPRADPINRALGAEGLRALFSGLRSLHGESNSLPAMERTVYGAYLAAVAFASAGSGLHHKICHALGGTFNLPHAETHSVVIGYVTAFNAPYATDAAERVSAALGGAAHPGNAIYLLRKEVGSPSSLAELGLRERDIPRAAEIILPSVPPSNPRPVDQADLESLLRAAWAGDPIE
ncbi:maleylacetate reductase [Microbacterium trichothecenolyticum]|uniref:maleylacetate reductase n=1 Tax=Microbacterium trichothecenolyticum TaxID=69370 RepID=UPI0035BEA0E9